jgi:hypothetical protein
VLGVVIDLFPLELAFDSVDPRRPRTFWTVQPSTIKPNVILV